jgi:hypothetical protein
MPRIVVELHCDTDLMIAMIKDKELEPAEVSAMLTAGVEQIMAALKVGLQKRHQQEEEDAPGPKVDVRDVHISTGQSARPEET